MCFHSRVDVGPASSWYVFICVQSVDAACRCCSVCCYTAVAALLLLLMLLFAVVCQMAKIVAGSLILIPVFIPLQIKHGLLLNVRSEAYQVGLTTIRSAYVYLRRCSGTMSAKITNSRRARQAQLAPECHLRLLHLPTTSSVSTGMRGAKAGISSPRRSPLCKLTGGQKKARARRQTLEQTTQQ